MTTSNETPETETTEDTPKPAEPIDAEFEPAQGPDPSEPKPAKSGVGMATVAAWSIGAALAGGSIGVIGAGASNIDTSKFAPSEIRTDVESLTAQQADVTDKLDKAWETLSVTEARLDGQVEAINAKLAARAESEELLRDEFEALIAQLDVLVGSDVQEASADDAGEIASENGEGDVEADATTTEVAPSRPPLQRLIDRITYLEARLAETDQSPETTGQLKRALTDVSARLDAVETADQEFQRAMDKREEALASLQSGLFNANQAIAEIDDRVVMLSETETPETSSADIEALRAEIAALQSAAAVAPAETRDTPPAEDVVVAEDAAVATETPASENAAPVVTAPDAAAVTEEELSERDQMALAISSASLAMAKLDGDSSNGKPFPSSWDSLKDAMPDNENIDAIKAISRRGAPTLSDIRTGFASVKTTLEKRIQDTAKKDGWDWARQAFGGVVSVRSTDIEGDTPEAALNRIALALDKADLPTAVENAELLEGFTDSEFDTWLSGARARLTLTTNIDAIREEILEKSAELAERN